MKKLNMAVAAALIAAFFSVNAQAQSEQVNNQMTAPQQTSQNAALVAAEDGMVALELAKAETSAKANKAARLERGDTIWMSVGNSAVQSEVWSQRIEGPYIAAVAGAVAFDGNVAPAIGAQGGYFGRHWGLAVTATASSGKWTGDGANAGDKFLEFNVRIDAQLEMLNWRNGHSRLALIGGPTFKRRFDYHDAETAEGKVSVFQYQETRAYTFGGEAGLRYEHKWWGKPAYVFVEATGGCQTNFLLHGREVKFDASVRVGVALNLFRGSSWNKTALSQTGMSKKAIKAAAREAIANY